MNKLILGVIFSFNILNLQAIDIWDFNIGTGLTSAVVGLYSSFTKPRPSRFKHIEEKIKQKEETIKSAGLISLASTGALITNIYFSSHHNGSVSLENKKNILPVMIGLNLCLFANENDKLHELTLITRIVGIIQKISKAL